MSIEQTIRSAYLYLEHRGASAFARKIDLCLDDDKLILNDIRTRYLFNKIEMIGNILLTPVCKIYKKLVDLEHYSVVNKILIVAAAILLSLTLGVFGLLVKRVGECFNPASTLRHSAAMQFAYVLEKSKLDQTCKQSIIKDEEIDNIRLIVKNYFRNRGISAEQLSRLQKGTLKIENFGFDFKVRKNAQYLIQRLKKIENKIQITKKEKWIFDSVALEKDLTDPNLKELGPEHKKIWEWTTRLIVKIGMRTKVHAELIVQIMDYESTIGKLVHFNQFFLKLNHYLGNTFS